jgi:Nuclease-related domain
LNYARRQQYRRLSRAGTTGVGSVGAVLLALVLASVGAISLAGLLLLTAVGLGFYTRYWLGLARRSAVGAHSENEVRHVLAALEAEGWQIRHGLRWQGRGDVDSVAIAPGGIGFAIETKTRSYDERHLVRVREQAVWLSRRRRRCRRGALPVLCVVRDRGVQRWEQGALVVSIDQLRSTLQGAAGGLGAPIGRR